MNLTGMEEQNTAVRLIHRGLEPRAGVDGRWLSIQSSQPNLLSHSIKKGDPEPPRVLHTCHAREEKTE